MNAEEKKRGERKTMLELLTCFEDFVKGLEENFLQIGGNLQSFKKRVTDIKQTFIQENTKKRQKPNPVKKVPRLPKQNPTKEHQTTKEADMKQKSKQKDEFLDNCINIFTLDQNNEIPKTIDLTGTFNQTLDFDINEWFLDIEDQKSKEPLQKQFYELEFARIKKSDPLASQIEIKKFVENKWMLMSEADKSKYFESCNKKKEPSLTKSTRKVPERNKEEDLNKFSRFLDKKANKPAFPSVEPIKLKKQSVSNDPVTQTPVSASELLSALQKEKIPKEPSSQPRLGWIFQNFQL